MDKAEETRIKRLYGCDDSVASYMIRAGVDIQHVEASKLRDEIKRRLDGDDGSPVPAGP